MARTFRPSLDMPPPPAARFGTEYALGTVLVFAKSYQRMKPGLGAYSYVAYRAGDGKWYLTGRETQAFTWPELVRFIGDSPCSICSEWTEIPQTGSGDPGEEIDRGSTAMLHYRAPHHWVDEGPDF